MSATDRPGPTYAFGDGPTAGDRLALLASVFEPSTEALLREHAPRRPSCAIDLGCGPGSTTRLLAEATGAARTIGLDASAAFVERARSDAPAGIEFLRHDVTRTPFPTPPADVVFARYLLAHLADPVELTSRWATQLAPDGRLLLEEVEQIDTSIPAFARYLELAVAVIAARGADMLVGRVLRDATAPGLIATSSLAVTIAPPTSTVARLFTMNLETWRHDPWLLTTTDRAEIDRLSRSLHDLLERDVSGEITWTHRQVVLVRAAASPPAGGR